MKQLYGIYVSMMLFGCAYASEQLNRELVAVEICDVTPSQVIYSHFKEHGSIVDEINSAYNQLVEKTKEAAEKAMSDASRDPNSIWYQRNEEKKQLEERKEQLPDEIAEINKRKPEGSQQEKAQQVRNRFSDKARKEEELNKVLARLKQVKDDIRMQNMQSEINQQLQYLANGLKNSSRVSAQAYKDVSEQITYVRAVLPVMKNYYTLKNDDCVTFLSIRAYGNSSVELLIPEAHSLLQKIYEGLGGLEGKLVSMQADDVKRFTEQRQQKEKQALLEAQLKKEAEEKQAFHKKLFFGGSLAMLLIIAIIASKCWSFAVHC